MKKKKTVAILLVAMAAVLGIGGIFYRMSREKKDAFASSAREGDVTRYEWLEMLCEQTGLTGYEEEEPYFSDVTEDHDCFSCIQSAVEWEVLEAGTEFHGEDCAEGRFVALTAMKTIGEQKLKAYLDLEGEVTEETYIRLALDYGLVEEQRLDTGLSREECLQVLETLRELYFGEFWGEDFSEMAYREGVVELPPGDLIPGDEDGFRIMMEDAMADALKPGTVVVMEDRRTGIRTAGKVEHRESGGFLFLSPVELDKVVEHLRASGITQLTFDHIAAYHGMEEQTAGRDWGNSVNVIPTRVFITGKMEDKGFKVSVSTAEEEGGEDGNSGSAGSSKGDNGNTGERYLKIEITDHNTGITGTLPLTGIRIGAKEEVSAEIDVESISIGAQADWSLTGGLNYAEAGISVRSTMTGTVKIFEKEIPPIKLFEGAVPVAGGAMSVDIRVYLVLSAEGSMSLSVELPADVAVSYERGKGLRHFQFDMAPEDPVVEVACEAGGALRLEPVLKALGIGIMDMELDTGFQVEAKTTLRPDGQICADLSLALPVITLSMCGDDKADTLLGKTGITGEWEILTSENAPVRIESHHEQLPGQTAQSVEECTWEKDPDSTAPDGEEGDLPGGGQEDPGNIPTDLNTYYVRYGDLYMVDAPRFCFDYPDNWKVEREETSQEVKELFGEQVVLSNDRGVTVTYLYYNRNPGTLGGGGRYITRYEAVKEADAAFEPYMPETDREMDPGNMVVARVRQTGFMLLDTDTDFAEVDGRIFYALLPEALLEESGGVLEPYGETGAMETFSFNYYGFYALIAQAPEGGFTEEEEREVVEILASFREN